MKISIAASTLILLVAALLGFHGHQKLADARETHAQLAASASELGITIDPSHPDANIRSTRRERVNKEADAKAIAAEFIAFAKEMESIEKNGSQPDEGQMKRIMEFMDRMMSLDTAQLKILIAEVRSAKDLKDQTREGLITFSIMTLANDHPQAALAMLTESSDMFKTEGMGTHVVSTALAKWAKDDPIAALDWVRKNRAKFPDLITDDAKRGLITGTAIENPGLAFKLIDELGLKKDHQGISSITSAAKTPAECTTTLAALREYLATLPDENAKKELNNTAMDTFARNLAREGFDAGSKWASEANLTPAELESFASGLQSSVKDGDSGKWIDWIGKTLPPEKAADKIEGLVGNWTSNDYQAAGKWLSTAPESPTKNAAVRSYAITVSNYEPATAAQWAMTLPPGEPREQTLKRIYHNWPADDPAAKEAFGKEHGFK